MRLTATITFDFETEDEYRRIQEALALPVPSSSIIWDADVPQEWEERRCAEGGCPEGDFEAWREAQR